MGDNTGQRGGRKLPSLKGVVMVDTWRGKLRIRKWPRSRPTRSAAQLDREDKFRQANLLYKYIPPSFQVIYAEASAGTPFYPRDLFVAGVYGRGPWWIDNITGKKVFPMPFKQAVSESLDTISQDVGSIIARGDELWEPIGAGTSGYVLTAQGAGLLPSWQPPSGGGSGKFWPSLRSGSSSNQTTAAHATTGLLFETLQNISVDAIWFLVAAASSVSFVGSLSSLDSVTESGRGSIPTLGAIDTVLGTTATVNGEPSASNAVGLRAAFASPVALNSGTRYLLAVSRTDGGTTSPTNIVNEPAGNDQGYALLGPVLNWMGSLQYSQTALASGHTPDATASNWPIIAIEGS